MDKNFQEVISITKRKIFPIFESKFEGLRFDYTPSSLEEIEHFLDKTFPRDIEKVKEVEILPFGIYLGEMIVKNIEEAKWQDVGWTKNNKVRAVKNYIKIETDDNSTFSVFPFNRILNYLNDRTDGIYAFYYLLEKHVNGELDKHITEDNKGKWIKLPNGMKLRIRKVDVM